MDTVLKLTKEKSEEQAEVIELIKVHLQYLDVEYCRLFIKELQAQASWQSSASVLNASYSEYKNDILMEKAEAMRLLCDFVDQLKKVDKLKLKSNEVDTAREKINKMFIE